MVNGISLDDLPGERVLPGQENMALTKPTKPHYFHQNRPARRNQWHLLGHRAAVNHHVPNSGGSLTDMLATAGGLVLLLTALAFSYVFIVEPVFSFLFDVGSFIFGVVETVVDAVLEGIQLVVDAMDALVKAIEYVVNGVVAVVVFIVELVYMLLMLLVGLILLPFIIVYEVGVYLIELISWVFNGITALFSLFWEVIGFTAELVEVLFWGIIGFILLPFWLLYEIGLYLLEVLDWMTSWLD